MERSSRGSFIDHRRKSLTYTNIFNDLEKADLQKPKLSFKSYMELLTAEKEEWKEMLKRKKIQFQNLERKHKSAPIKITLEDVKDFLRQEDKDFLESKPNYSNIIQLSKTYVDSVNYFNEYKLDVTDYCKKAFRELDFHKKMLVDEMCATDLCDICNMRNCGWPDHKFDLDF